MNGESLFPEKQENSIRYIQELIQKEFTFQENEQIIRTSLPDAVSKQSSFRFQEAYSEINTMLEGESPMSLKRAVFLCENAFFDGRMNYTDYCKQLEQTGFFLKACLKQEQLDVNEQNINYIVHRYLCDTLTLSEQIKPQKSYPIAYDFSDPFGVRDLRKLFVSKLLAEKSGQCKSMPLLFLILVEELGGKAYLSFAPSHSFIKCRKRNGDLYNLELTNGHIVSDSWLVASGFVKAEAIRSGVYMDTLNKKMVVANCLNDLALYYRMRFHTRDMRVAYDAFSLQCMNRVLEVHSTNVLALLEKSNYYTVLLNYVAYQKAYREEREVINDPVTKKLFIQRNKLYALTDGLGLEYMSETQYKNWLNQLGHE